MLVTFIEKEAQEEFVDQFKTAFSERFGVVPHVAVENQFVVQPSEVELIGLAEIIDSFIPDHVKKEYTSCITSRRIRELVMLRMIFMMLAKDMGYSLVEIGTFCGGRDHSTVIYNINSGYDLLEKDKSFQELYMKISYIVNPKIYPHARITFADNETSDQCESISLTTLSGTVKLRVKRPASSRQWGASLGHAKRAYHRREAINPQSPDNTVGSTGHLQTASV